MSKKMLTKIDHFVAQSKPLDKLVDWVVDQLFPKVTASAAACATLLNARYCFKKTAWVDAPAMCGGQGAYTGYHSTLKQYSNGRKVVQGSSATVCVSTNPYLCPSSTCS